MKKAIADFNLDTDTTYKFLFRQCQYANSEAMGAETLRQHLSGKGLLTGGASHHADLECKRLSDVGQNAYDALQKYLDEFE